MLALATVAMAGASPIAVTAAGSTLQFIIEATNA